MAIAQTARIVILLVILAILGCNKEKAVGRKKSAYDDLDVIGAMYRTHENAYGKPPSGVQGLKQITGADLKSPDAKGMGELFEDIENGKYVVIWNVKSSDYMNTPAGKGGTILGYEKDTLTAGGMVLMVDGTVKNMTAAEFQSAPKAGEK